MDQSIRSFLQMVERDYPDEFIRITRPVDPKWESCAVVRKLYSEGRFPIVYFEKARNSSLPIVANVHVDTKKVAMAMGVPVEQTLEEYARREINRIAPVQVSSGPVKEVIKTGKEVDLNLLPITTHSHKDDAPYVTMGVAVCKSFDSGRRNMGIYRHRLRGRNELGIYYSWGKHIQFIHHEAELNNRKLEIAIVIGMHPLFYYASQSLVSGKVEMDEYDVVGGLMGEPLEVVPCETVDLEVPAQAEIVIEGEILPHERKTEGPFGEYTDYYGQIVDAPTVHVKAITHRKDAIYQDVGYNVEHVYLASAPREGYLLRELRKIIPTIKHVHIPSSGTCFHVYISLKKLNEGDPKNILMAALGMDPFLKLGIAVDEDINVYDERQVLWALATRTQADRDFFMVPGARGNRLDPMTYTTLRNQRDGMVTKVGIDATLPSDLPYQIPEVISNPLVGSINLDDYIKTK